MRFWAISLWEPWATLLVYGHKRYETRSWCWPEHKRGCILIHAAKRWTGDQRRLIQTLPFRHLLQLCGVDSERDFHRGCVIGSVQPGWCYQTAGFVTTDVERAVGDWAPGRYATEMHKPARCLPFPYRGSQGFFEVTVPVSAQLATVTQTIRQGALHANP
jgi:hypothetical protein